MLKLFLDWIDLKFKLNTNNKGVKSFKEGEIWWCAIGQNIGNESYGKSKFFSRPVLIFRKLSNNLFFGIPLSTKIKTGTWFVPVTIRTKTRTVLLNQIRTLDEKRLYSKISELDDKDFDSVKMAFIKLIYHK